MGLLPSDKQKPYHDPLTVYQKSLTVYHDPLTVYQKSLTVYQKSLTCLVYARLCVFFAALVGLGLWAGRGPLAHWGGYDLILIFGAWWASWAFGVVNFWPISSPFHPDISRKI